MSGLRVQPRRVAARAGLDVARPQADHRAHCRHPHRRRCARCWKRRCRRTSSRSPAGVCCGTRTSCSGTRRRDNWSQLYLYDLTTGQLKTKVTSGDGPVSGIVRVDAKARTLWYTAQGREAGQDPYLRHAYRIGLDGRNARSLTPGRGRSHGATLARRPLDGGHLVGRRHPAADRAARCERHGGDDARGRPTSRSSWPAAGSRRSCSASRLPTAPPTSTASSTAPPPSTRRRSTRSSTTPIPARRPAAWVAAASRRRMATSRRWPSWASSW